MLTNSCVNEHERNHKNKTTTNVTRKQNLQAKFQICMPVFGVKEWKNHLRVLRFGAISKIQCRYKKLPYWGMKPRFCLKRFTEVEYGPSFYPKGSKLSLFSLYGQRFPRYGPLFKIAIFGHETWPSTKVPEVAHVPSFYPGGGGGKF